MDVRYMEKIKQWVEYDNRIQRNKKDIQTVVEKKKDVETELLDYVSSQKMDRFTINISDGNIKFTKMNVKPPLTQKVLRDTLQDYLAEKDIIMDIEDFLQYMNEKNETKTKYIMKRDIKTSSSSADQ